MFNDMRHVRNTFHLLAWSFGFGLAFLVFLHFLQTPIVRLSKLFMTGAVFAVSAFAALWISNRRLIPSLEKSKDKNSIVFTAFLLPILFLPFNFISPDFPVSPLLQPQTDAAFQLEIADASQPLTLSRDDVYLKMGKEALGLQSFDVESGRPVTDQFEIRAGGSEFFRWQGSAAELITLAFVLPPAQGTLTVIWDGEKTVFQLSPDSPNDIVIKKKFDPPFALGVLSFLAWFAILAFLALSPLTLLWDALKRFDTIPSDKKWRSIFIVGVILLSALLIKFQVDGIVGGLPTLNTEQLERHTDVLRGVAPNPWQYRVLSEWIAAGFVKLFGFLSHPDAVVFGFLSFRLLQNILIFCIAFPLYKRLGGSPVLGLLGIALLANSMKNALFESDLSFNTYFDLIFYLLAAWWILDKRYLWIIPLTFLASLNRETSGLIPFLLLSSAWMDSEFSRWKRSLPAFFSFAVWGIVFMALRLAYPDRPLFIPYGHAPGFSLLVFNLTRPITWTELFHTLGFIPLLGLPVFFAWHPNWRNFFFIMIPVWFVVHAFASVMAETRLFLVPQAVVFIPGIIFLFRHLSSLSTSTSK